MDNSAGDIASVLRSAWTGSELVHALTHHNKLFFFSYSPRLKSLVSWSSNCREVLGISEAAVARDANLFLRHTHHEDRFKLLPALESALRDGTHYRVTYRWIRPDNKELCWLHCRAKLSRYDNENLFEGVIADMTDELHPQFTPTSTDSEQRLFEALPFATGILDADLRLAQVSGKLMQVNFGDPDFSQEHFQIGRHFLRCFKNTSLREQYRSALLDVARRNAAEQELCYTFKGQWIRVILRAIDSGENPPGILITAIDRSESAQLIQEVDSLRESKRYEVITHAVLSALRDKIREIHGVLSQPTHQRDSAALRSIISKHAEDLRQLEDTISDLSTELPSEILVSHNISLLVATSLKQSSRIFSGGRTVHLDIAQGGKVTGSTAGLRNLFGSFIQSCADLFPASIPLTIRTEAESKDGNQYLTCTIAPKGNSSQPVSPLTEEQLVPWDTLRAMASHAGGEISLSNSERGLKAATLRLPKDSGI